MLYFPATAFSHPLYFGASYYSRWRAQHYLHLKAVLFPYTRMRSKVFMTLRHTSHPRSRPLPANKLYSVLRHITTIRQILILYVATFFIFRFTLATCKHMHSTLLLFLAQSSHGVRQCRSLSLFSNLAIHEISDNLNFFTFPRA
jgi:hypothetical protein